MTPAEPRPNILTIAQQKWLYSKHPALQAQAVKT